MLTKTIFSASALLSIAAAVPMAQQNKRDYIYETTTIKEVTTVDVTTTVWLSAGETAPAHYGHGHHHSKVTTHITQTTTVPAKAPATESSPPEQSTYEAPSPSVPVAPTTSTDVPRAVTTSAAPAPTTSSSSSGGASSGGQYTGEATYYTPGLGSCGLTNTDSDMIVALAEDMMMATDNGNPNTNPTCGKSITISYNGVTATATIVDTCPGCSGAGLDMTPSLFQKFSPLGTGRLFGVEWSYN